MIPKGNLWPWFLYYYMWKIQNTESVGSHEYGLNISLDTIHWSSLTGLVQHWATWYIWIGKSDVCLWTHIALVLVLIVPGGFAELPWLHIEKGYLILRGHADINVALGDPPIFSHWFFISKTFLNHIFPIKYVQIIHLNLPCNCSPCFLRTLLKPLVQSPYWLYFPGDLGDASILNLV